MKAAFLLSILLLGGGIAEAQAPRGSDAAAHSDPQTFVV